MVEYYVNQEKFGGLKVSAFDTGTKRHPFYLNLIEFKAGRLKIIKLLYNYIYCCRAFLALFYVKSDAISFVQRFKTG